MEVSAINTSPKIEKKSNFRRNVTTSALSGVGIGAIVNGAEIAIKQKSILKNPDMFIKTVQEEMAANVDNAELQEKGKAIIQNITDFAKGGKIDKKAVWGSALKGAISVGALFGAITAASQLIKNHKAAKANHTQKA